MTRTKGYCKKWRRRWGCIKRGRDDLHYSPLSFVAVSWHNATTWMMKVGMQRNEGGWWWWGRGCFEGVDDAASVTGGLTRKPHGFLSSQSRFSGERVSRRLHRRGINVSWCTADERETKLRWVAEVFDRSFVFMSCVSHHTHNSGGFSPCFLGCASVWSATPGTTRPIPGPLIGINSCLLSIT